MKSLVDLLEHLLHDCERRSGAPLGRDVKTLRSRAKHEGDSFITITLPAYCKDFERSLDSGRIAPDAFSSFRKTRAGIPAFLQGLLCNVFGPEGLLLPEPSIDCIRFVRQICLFGKKIQRPCSSAREKDAIAAFKKCDDDVVAEPSGQLRRYFRVVASILHRGSSLRDSSFIDDLVPKHGPGATRERLLGNQKWSFVRWHQRLEECGFTYFRFGRASKWCSTDDLDAWPEIVEPGDETPVKVTLVPKTLKTPRVIAVEPVCMQFAQQALKRALVDELDNSSFTRGHVNFRDQTVNQVMAKRGSRGDNFATLDMSEASDRVSVAHVRDLFETCPQFLEAVLAARSTRAELPTGEVIHLRKFASMGSALTFPIEALVFFTTIIASRCLRAGVFPTARSVHSFGRDVYVYGDDLIVPADEAPAICEDLEALGFKVNRSKSFWTGQFRESCGMDCYGNEEVTPVYLRHDLPTDRADASGILSTISTSDQLYRAGYFEVATALGVAVDACLGQLPQVPQESPALGWRFRYSEAKPRRRWNVRLQRTEMYAYVPFSPTHPDPLEGDGALAKCFRIMDGRKPIHELLPHVEESSCDPEHLERSVTPYGVTLKRRWVPLNS